MNSMDDLEFFSNLAKHDTLTDSARELGLSLPAISKRLKLLEQRLGVQLITRTTRRLDLTTEGVLYLKGARPILNQLNELENAVSSRQSILRGRLHINASFGFGRRHITPLLSGFSQHHPELELSIDLTSKPVNLLDSGVDIDIRVGEPPDSRLIAHHLLHNPRILCASPDYLESAGIPRSVEDLQNFNCIILRQFESDYAMWRFTRNGNEFSQKVKGTLTSNDGEVVVRLALDGHGIILRSNWDIHEHILSGKLVPILPDYQAPHADIYAVYQQRRHTPERISKLVHYLSEKLGERFQ